MSRRAPGFLRSPFSRFVLQVAVGAAIVVGLIGLLVACAANPQGSENFGSTSSALAVSGLFPTGVDGTGTPLAVGSVDPHYTLSSDDATRPGPNALVVAPVAGWIGNTATSNWLSAQANGSGANLGNYTFTTTFSLAGVDPSTVTISGSWACDDSCVIRLNGTVVATNPAPAWNAVAAFTIPAGSPFVMGTNTLAFVATNSGGGATGLQVVTIGGTSLGCTADNQCSSAQFCNTQTATCVGTLPSGTPIPTLSGHTPALNGTCASGVGESVCDAGVCDMSDNECGLANGNGPCTFANGATLCQSGACSVNGTCEPSGGCNVDGDCAANQQCDLVTNKCVALVDAGPDGAGAAGDGSEGEGGIPDASEGGGTDDGGVGADGSEGDDGGAIADGSPGSDGSSIADGSAGTDGSGLADASAGKDGATADASEEDATARAGEEGGEEDAGPNKVLEGDGLSCAASPSGPHGSSGPSWALGLTVAMALARRRRDRTRRGASPGQPACPRCPAGDRCE
jgi:MYXO-CTERM domain-containing protein